MSPKTILSRAKELGCPAVALTDTHAGYGLLEFYMEGGKMDNLQPILGAEIAISLDSRFEKRAGIDGKEGSIVLLVQNYIGYKNLVKILSESHLQGFFMQPRADFELLAEHCGGLIVLTGSCDGLLGKAYLDQGADKALGILDQLKETFGRDHVYLEMVSRQKAEQQDVNKWKASIASSVDLPLVLTSDARYSVAESEEAADIFYCIGQNQIYSDQTREKKVSKNWFKSWEEMEAEVFYLSPEVREEARLNALGIADKVDLEIPLGQNLLPNFEVPQGESEGSFLRKQCEAAIKGRYEAAFGKIHLEGDVGVCITPQLVQERLDYELGVIGEMGFEAYFLIVSDFIQFAKDNHISVGPGRGSAAGSIVSYLMGITNVDPLKYELLFERFLNPERISMPDIDIDFSDERRDEVLQYVIEKYGESKVSKVCTFGTLAAKAALKDVGRAMGVPFAKMNAMTKLLPSRPGFALTDASGIKDFTDLLAGNPDLKKVFEVALKLEGCVRHVSVHACAVIIGRDDLTDNAILQWAPGTEDVKITQFPYQQLETVGLLKMDFLGLKNLSVLEKTLNNIEQTTGQKLDLDTLPMDDTKTFEMMAKGETTGVFQFESSGMRRYLKELKPTEFEDLVAMNALYRPGPMEYIPTYIKGKHNPRSVKYPNKVLEPILRKTYGIAVYQEQILRIAQDFAGFTLGGADILRKAIGKKIMEILSQQREKFIQGAVAKGHKEKEAEKLFDEVVVPFSGYGFNRSHAVCYARIAYETAYMRANYPVEFMAAMMTTDRNNTDRISLEMNECIAMEIEVLPPSVNESGSHFTVIKEDDSEIRRIRFGLTAIKGLGEETVNMVIREREQNGWYNSLQDFARRLPTKVMNKKTLEALAFSGAFDGFGNRGAVVASLDELSKFAREYEEKEETGQIGLFAGTEQTSMEFTLRDIIASKEEILNWERESMGLFVSDHPLRGLDGYFKQYGSAIGEMIQISEEPLEENLDSEEIKNQTPPKTKKRKKKEKAPTVVIHGLVTSVRKVTTKTGSLMLIFHIEDTSGKVECVIFPKVYERLNVSGIKLDAFLRVEGRLEERNGLVGFVVDAVRVGDLQQVQKLWSEGKSLDDNPQSLWILEIPDHVTKPKINLIKQFLVEARSEAGEASQVEVHIHGKKVDIPFKILLDEDLKTKITELLKEEERLEF